jgi:hypothetical protein
MHILDKLPLLNSKDEEVEPVLSEEDLKAERIEFHRNKVRNGPAKFSEPTSGQIRRERHRALARQTKRARRNQIKSHFASKREIAVLRGHLQAAGLILYRTDYRPGAGDVTASFIWIISHFADDKLSDELGRIEITEGVVRSSLQAALNRYQHLTGRPVTKISEDYVLPIGVAA